MAGNVTSPQILSTGSLIYTDQSSFSVCNGRDLMFMRGRFKPLNRKFAEGSDCLLSGYCGDYAGAIASFEPTK